MAFPFTIHPEARKEALHEISWLENSRENLGKKFNEVLDQTISRILENPNQFPLVLQNPDRRKALFSKPFHKSHCIYFEMEDENIRIISVFNNKRNPSSWQEREP